MHSHEIYLFIINLPYSSEFYYKAYKMSVNSNILNSNHYDYKLWIDNSLKILYLFIYFEF